MMIAQQTYILPYIVAESFLLSFTVDVNNPFLQEPLRDDILWHNITEQLKFHPSRGCFSDLNVHKDNWPLCA